MNVISKCPYKQVVLRDLKPLNNKHQMKVVVKLICTKVYFR